MRKNVVWIAKQLAGELIGDQSLEIAGVAAVEKAAPNEITYVSDEAHISALKTTTAGAVILSRHLLSQAKSVPCQSTLILVDDAQESFINILQIFRTPRQRLPVGISPNAYVDETASIGSEACISPNVHIGKNVAIGDRCELHPGVVIGDGCRIGNDAILYPNCVLHPDVVVGDRVIIDSCAVLGADGFGFRLVDGAYVRIPHMGNVVIGDDVEIGACATIDRGMIGPTVIGAGSKLDNQVLIAHNCELGKHNAFAGQVGFAGSVTTGDYVRCAGQVGVADHLHLGTQSTLAARAAVHKSVPDGETHFGYPAREVSSQTKILMSVTKIPDLRQRVRKLEKELKEITSLVAKQSATSINDTPKEDAA